MARLGSDPRPPASHKLLVTPGRQRLIMSCVACGEMAVDLTCISLELMQRCEEAHQLSIARKLIEPNVYP